MPHGKIYQNVAETLGNTPLISLNRMAAGLPARVAVKHEGYNPYNSVKDRIGAAMIDDAVEKGHLRPGMVIVEPTSGNTGIGLAYVAAARGYRCIFTMPDTMTQERRHMLRALGAKFVLTEGAKGMKGAIARAEEILARLGDRAWMPRQFENPANPAILDTKIYDEVVRVTNDDAIATARRLAREEAIFAGISSGSITWAALQVAARPENAGKLIVSIVCDFGERYLSHPVYTELADPDISDLDEALAAPTAMA